MDPLTRNSDTTPLHPAFRSLLLGKLVPALAAEGIPLQPYECARSPERQADLYDHGRVAGVGALGHYVTWDVAWVSHHEYGLAVDMVFHVNGQWTWSEPRSGMWEKYQKIVAACGLEPARRKDGKILEWPHAQLPWPTVKLRAGEYPPGGDQPWADALNAGIQRWGDQPRSIHGTVHPGAPPRARIEPDRPPLDAACFPPPSKG